MKINRTQLLLHSVTSLILRQAKPSLERLLEKSHPTEIVAVVRQLPETQALQVMLALKGQGAEGKVFALLGGRFLHTYLLASNNFDHVTKVFKDLPREDVASLIDEVGEPYNTELLSRLNATQQEVVSEVLQYGEESCGRIMSVRYFSLNQQTQAHEAILQLQKNLQVDGVYYVYVVDDFGNLTGVVSLRQILLVPATKCLHEFMTRDVIRVNVHDSQQKAARLVEEYNFVGLPVVSDDGKLMGVMTVDDVIDIIRDQAQDDVLQMAGVEVEAIEDFSFWRALGSRFFWYGLLLLSGLLCLEILLLFQNVSFLILPVLFVPLVLRLGSHFCTQTLTLLEQGLFAPQIERGRARRAVLGQFLALLLTGLFLAMIAGFYGAWRFADFQLISMALALFLACTFSIIMAVLLHFLFKKFASATRSGALRALLLFADVLILFVYFSLFMLFKGLT